MIIVDTSVWADHFRGTDSHLVLLWTQGVIAQHPLIVGELAMGNLRDWPETVRALQAIPEVRRIDDEEVIDFVAMNQLMGCGIGFIDAHILAAVAHEPGSFLWTRDKRLAVQAERLSLGYSPG